MDRLERIDIAKGGAIICVVLIHAGPFLSGYDRSAALHLVGQVVQQLCSWAVPFFFAAAGFLFSRRLTPQGAASAWWRYVTRLLLVLLAWTLIDGVLAAGWLRLVVDAGSLAPLYWNLRAIPGFAAQHPGLFWFRGTSVSLWFLVSLIIAISWLALAARAQLSRPAILVVGLLAYLAAVLLGSYAPWLDIALRPVLEHRGPLIAIGFVSIGHFLGTARVLPALVRPAGAVTLAWLAVFLEAWALSEQRGTAFQEFPYLLSTPALVALLMRAACRPGPARGPIASSLATLGRHSLGIYLVHIPVLNALAPYKPHSPWAEALLPVAVLVPSLIGSALLRQTPLLRAIVR